MAVAVRSTVDGAHVTGEVLSAYVDQELPGETLQAVEAHLHACPVCRAVVQDYHATAMLVGMLPRQAVPTQLSEDFLCRFRTATQGEHSQRQTAA
jgi:predicted anti-sigma-YlaC factor YlaD